MPVKSTFEPVRRPDREIDSKDLNRIQDAIDAALKKLAADVQAALDKKKDK